MTQETVTNGTEALFTREGMPPVKEMIPCALQHVLASFAGIITPAVIMAGVYGFNSQQSTDIIQVALILSAIDTALQAFASLRRRICAAWLWSDVRTSANPPCSKPC